MVFIDDDLFSVDYAVLVLLYLGIPDFSADCIDSNEGVCKKEAALLKKSRKFQTYGIFLLRKEELLNITERVNILFFLCGFA